MIDSPLLRSSDEGVGGSGRLHVAERKRNAPPAALLIKAGDGSSMMTELSHPGARAGEDKNNGRG
jgi:hypothetical protein